MLDEINQQRQCQTCSVCFPTNDELRDHLDGYRSQERLLSAKLEQCRAHSSPLDDEHDTSYDAHDYDNGYADGDAHDSTLVRRNDKPADQLCCPHEECDRDRPFSKRTRLVRHFALHVQCKEVCVYCFKVFKVASQYIAHADTHKDADMTKNSYTRQICDRLREIAAEGLDKCQGVETKKRTRELVGTPGARRVKGKLDVDDTITSSSPSHFPGFTGTNSLSSDEASLQPVPVSALHLNSIGASARVPIETLDEYGAAIFWSLTYPSNHVAQQFSGEIGDIQTSIMDPSDLGVGEYSAMRVQEGYMFGHPHNGGEEYHGQS